MEELDAISSQVPIFVLRRDGHSCAVNSAFYRLSGLTDKVSGVEVDPRCGRPTGTLRAQAMELARKIRARLVGQEDRGEAVRRACWQTVKKGVTTVHALCAREGDVDLLVDLAEELPVDVVPYLITLEVDQVLSRGLSQIGGDLMVDGSLGSHTAALFEPYADRPDHRGQLYFEQERLVDFVTKAHGDGLQVAMHAIGDRAMEQVLSAYEAVLDRDPREGHRHRIEHAELLAAEQIQRLGDRGVVLAVQPAFEAFWGGPGGMYERRLGPQRVKQTNPFRALMDAGVVIAGGSDSYVTPIDPLAGMAAAVNHPNVQHRVSPLEAVQMFTTNGAYLAFQEDQKGLLQEGMRADLAILSADPRSVPGEAISQIQINMVIKDGEIVVGPEEADDTFWRAKK
jgi:predicted amidohydrolase YtcJ